MKIEIEKTYSKTVIEEFDFKKNDEVFLQGKNDFTGKITYFAIYDNKKHYDPRNYNKNKWNRIVCEINDRSFTVLQIRTNKLDIDRSLCLSSYLKNNINIKEISSDSFLFEVNKIISDLQLDSLQ